MPGCLTLTARFVRARSRHGLFRTHWSKGKVPPPSAHVAAFYQGYWFYIDAADNETKSTFSLLMELSRLDLQTSRGDRPLLTLPLSR
jgi:hypothetical protein